MCRCRILSAGMCRDAPGAAAGGSHGILARCAPRNGTAVVDGEGWHGPGSLWGTRGGHRGDPSPGTMGVSPARRCRGQ